jgi:alanyl-tRNA synthetase
MRHNRLMPARSSDQIRSTFLEFFEANGHALRPSGSLVPASFDSSVLLTTAGMHPLKEYFMGLEKPPATRLTSCQKCFRTTDIENVGNTARHLTFFEMLGNFSLGDYFKEGAIELAWKLSLEGFGFDAEKIWITVFEGDKELGLGADEEAIAAWEAVGVPRERIVLCPRSENFWQAGPTGPCGPCSELYLDRGEQYGEPDDLPGGENDRFLEYWNLVFMEFDQNPEGVLAPLPAKNIDTGAGLNRLALIEQDVESVFETDQFAGLMALGRELGAADADTRSLRILADHSRAMTFLIADGIVPSNEDRGYILRRVMRRAVLQGQRIGIEGQFLPAFAEQVIDVMGAAYPELVERRKTILEWVRGEEESFGRTLVQGSGLLDQLLDAGTLSGEDAFRLHDTFGFPIELTRELADERGVPFAQEDEFDRLMGEQRTRSAAGAGERKVGVSAEAVRAVGGEQARFVGYQSLSVRTNVVAIAQEDGRTLVKLADSPFYAEGGGQTADIGALLSADGAPLADVVGVIRAGDDQALVVEAVTDALQVGAEVLAEVDATARHATECNHTATHLLHGALRERLGDHVRQAGSYVGPDKLRFDFNHSARLSDDDRQAVEDQVNAMILESLNVRALTTTIDEAQKLGAMALFGEKYGEIVRMVEIGDGSFSRELCGGTHVARTSEIGCLKIISEGSSAANVRRIEAITGPVAVALLRSNDRLLNDAAQALKTTPDQLPTAVAKLAQGARSSARDAGAALDEEQLAGAARDLGGAKLLVANVGEVPAKALMDVADRLKAKLGDDAAVIVGSVAEGRVSLVVAVTPALVERGVKAGEVVAAAAAVVGGGGGGRDTIAQAGGKDPEKLEEALALAAQTVEEALAV